MPRTRSCGWRNLSIHKLCLGRIFRDAVQDGDYFRLRFMDGFELVCAWDSSGPEVKAHAQGVVTAEMAIHPQFRYVSGKTVRAILTDGEKLIIEFTDGHALRSSFGRGGPRVEGVDVRVTMPSPIAALASAGAF
jgi:hypothetical protein